MLRISPHTAEDREGQDMRLTIEVSEGAGNDFLDTVLAAVNDERSNVYVQVAGEYGHLVIESADLDPEDDR